MAQREKEYWKFEDPKEEGAPGFMVRYFKEAKILQLCTTYETNEGQKPSRVVSLKREVILENKQIAQLIVDSMKDMLSS